MIFKNKIGLGTGLLGIKPEHQEFANFAIENGVRLFDIAEKYVNGEAERIIGNSIAESKVPRTEFDIITKFSPNLDPEVSIVESLSRLKLDYVDAYMIHYLSPEMRNINAVKALIIKLMKIKEKGLTKHIGVSNLPVDAINMWRRAENELGLAPGNCLEVCEYRYSLVKREADVKMNNLMQELGMTAMPYSPFGGGRMSGSAKPPQPGFPGDFWINERTLKLRPIAESIGATIPQLILAFCNRFPNSVIFPQTFKKENLLDNMQSVRFIPLITKTVYDQIEEVFPLSFSVPEVYCDAINLKIRESLPD